MNNSLTEIMTNKIDDLTYKLYEVEQKILNMEELARQRWQDKYEPQIYSRDYIKYQSMDDYYEHVIGTPRYKRLINEKMLIESELSFCYKHIDDLNNM